jgi:hypothetical protein
MERERQKQGERDVGTEIKKKGKGQKDRETGR